MVMKQQNLEELKVPPKHSGQRADVVFSSLLSGFSRSQVRRLIDEKNILVEGKAIKPSKKLEGGELVSVLIPPPEPLDLQPQNIPISIIYEDDEIIVVNKPPGITVHPGAGTKDGTLVNALLYICRDLSGIGGKIRPGIVHRLDKDTSGVLVVAKCDFSHQHLVGQFKSRRVEKQYLAIVAGEIKKSSGSFSSSIGRHPTNRIKMTSKLTIGREAITYWRAITRYKEATMVEVMPKTGRTHQIRVHFAENGYPIVGDKIYGARKHRSLFLEYVSKRLGRQALHASIIRFEHPRTGEKVEFKAPLSDDLKEVVKLFEEKSDW